MAQSTHKSGLGFFKALGGIGLLLGTLARSGGDNLIMACGKVARPTVHVADDVGRSFMYGDDVLKFSDDVLIHSDDAYHLSDEAVEILSHSPDAVDIFEIVTEDSEEEGEIKVESIQHILEAVDSVGERELEEPSKK